MPICDNLSRKHRPFFCEKTWQNRGIYTKNKSGEIEKWKGGVHGTKIQQITHNIRPKPQKSSSKAKKFILPGTAPENSLASWQNARTRTHRPRLPASAGKGPPSKCRPVCDKTRKNRKEKGSPPHLKPFRPPLQQETAAPKTVPVTTQRKARTPKIPLHTKNPRSKNAATLKCRPNKKRRHPLQVPGNLMIRKKFPNRDSKYRYHEQPAKKTTDFGRNVHLPEGTAL